jgi:hypothetical protein
MLGFAEPMLSVPPARSEADDSQIVAPPPADEAAAIQLRRRRHDACRAASPREREVLVAGSLLAQLATVANR